MDKYICIHGHFYQPPRENPWLESVEVQESAYPYHDWNERITSECYAPNTAARILDPNLKIIDIVNNYSKMSFNFGPTLLSWLEDKTPDIYQAILQADIESFNRFSGHGSALAQAYNHMIMPLSHPRDKVTQIIWGIQDFESRFKRKPEGMWLPETAVNVETLDLMAEQGIKFTILDSSQANRMKPKGADKWRSVSGSKIDPTRAYECRLPSGKSIALFFYDGPIAKAVAFERLLNNGDHFAKRLMEGFSNKRNWPQLMHIATDGESYGHHHRQGEMALAYALHAIEANKWARLTNYGEFLERFPPIHEVEIHNNTAWSCVHGVGRWMTDCGCNSGGHGGWNQKWREPLRNALDWLRDELSHRFENKAKEFIKDPWHARNDYITVILNRDPNNIDQFFLRHQTRDLNEGEKIYLLKLFELQRHCMLMYTSCGWFFDEISGIETVQVIQYAGRAIQLAKDIFGDDMEGGFKERLSLAKSNISGHHDGGWIYEHFVKPAMVDLKSVGAHYAISSLFSDYKKGAVTYSFSVDRKDYQTKEAGKAKLALGRIRIKSSITFENSLLTFGVLHQGDHNLSGGIREFRGEKEYDQMAKEMKQAFIKADFHETLRTMDRHFGSSTYSLKSLFRDEQRAILNLILKNTIDDADSVYLKLYENNGPLLQFLMELNVPIPRSLQTAMEFYLNGNLRQAVQQDEIDFEKINALLYDAQRAKLTLDVSGLRYDLEKTLEKTMSHLKNGDSKPEHVQKAEATCTLVSSLPFEINLWKVQNDVFKISKNVFPQIQKKAQEGDTAAQTWIKAFNSLGEKLHLHIN
jgi:alpha-amylase/alpha-mannosidase (GH57 family)